MRGIASCFKGVAPMKMERAFAKTSPVPSPDPVREKCHPPACLGGTHARGARGESGAFHTLYAEH